MPPEFVVFLDENHCNTPHLLSTLALAGVWTERHSHHFAPGTPDTMWLPRVVRNGWILLTADKRIRYRHLEKAAVERYNIRMFCFTRNATLDVMANAVARALPRMRAIVEHQVPPFIATIAINGEVHVRELFGAEAASLHSL